MVSDSRELSKEDSELRYLKRSRPFVVCLWSIPIRRWIDNSRLDESPECITLPVGDLLRPTLQTSNKFARSLFNDCQRFSFQTRRAIFASRRLAKASQRRTFREETFDYWQNEMCDLRKGLSRRKLEIASVCLAYRLKASFAFRDGPWNVGERGIQLNAISKSEIEREPFQHAIVDAVESVI